VKDEPLPPTPPLLPTSRKEREKWGTQQAAKRPKVIGSLEAGYWGYRR